MSCARIPRNIRTVPSIYYACVQVYVCGVSEDGDPPPSAEQVEVNPAAVQALREVAASVSQVSPQLLLWHLLVGKEMAMTTAGGPWGQLILSFQVSWLHGWLRQCRLAMGDGLEPRDLALQDLAAAKVLREQACYLPCTNDGLPLIGRMPGLSNAYVATAHSCWGILNSPATGLALSELIVDGEARSVDLQPFDPARHGGL